MTKRILAVEGNDDKHVVLQICEKHKIEETFEIKDFNGVDSIIGGLQILLKTYDSLAIIVDADMDPKSRWDSIRNRAYDYGFSLPENPVEGGFCAENDEGKKFGVWLMPNNTIPGMLEDFLKDLVPPQDETLPLVRKFIEDMPYVNGRFADKHKSKALIRTYLAVQEEPGLPFGTAIKAKYFNSDGPEIIKLSDWSRCVLVS